MKPLLNYYPEDRKEARKFFMGYVILVAEAIGADKDEIRHEAIRLAKAYINGEVSDEVMVEIYSKWDAYRDKEEFWQNLGSLENDNISFCLTLSNIAEASDDELNDDLDHLLVMYHCRNFDTSNERELRRQYFSKYAPKG